MTMTKADLVELVADEVDVPRKKADELVQIVLESIVAALHRDEKVELRGFGSFLAPSLTVWQLSLSIYHHSFSGTPFGHGSVLRGPVVSCCRQGTSERRMPRFGRQNECRFLVCKYLTVFVS